MNDRPITPTDSDVPAVGHAWRAGRASGAVTERIFLLDRPKYVRQVSTNLNAAHGGLVLCDADAGAGVIALRKSGYTGVLVEDVAAYETEAATADEAMVQVRTTGLHVSVLLRLGKVAEAEISKGDSAYDAAMANGIVNLLDDLAMGRAVIRYR